MAKCKNCAFPAKEARVFTLTQRMWVDARHNRILATTSICFSFTVVDEHPHLHVDDHAQVIADEDEVEIFLHRVNLEAQSCEQGEGVDLRFERLVVGHLE